MSGTMAVSASKSLVLSLVAIGRESWGSCLEQRGELVRAGDDRWCRGDSEQRSIEDGDDPRQNSRLAAWIEVDGEGSEPTKARYSAERAGVCGTSQSRVELTCSTADTGAARRDGAHGRAGERTTELT